MAQLWEKGHFFHVAIDNINRWGHFQFICLFLFFFFILFSQTWKSCKCTQWEWKSPVSDGKPCHFPFAAEICGLFQNLKWGWIFLLSLNSITSSLHSEIVKSLSRVLTFATPWTVSSQPSPPSMDFPARILSGLPFFPLLMSLWKLPS